MLDKLKALLPDSTRKMVAWAVVAFAIWGVNRWLGTEFPTPPVPAFGWVKDPVAVEQVSSTLRFKVFGDTPAGQNAAALPKSVYLWDVYRKVDPAGPPCKNQGQVGSCVSFGTNNAILRSMACDIVIGGRAFELKDIAEEVTYAGSRVEIGGGRLRGGDGSVGAWAAQFVQKYGVVAREVHGQYDLSKYDQARCRAWGASGVPAELEAVAREHPVQEITRITSWEEAKKALSQGYGIAICSSQGFRMTRDARGVAQASGTWQHCMCLDGYHTEGTAEFGHIENSWGPDTHKGPVGWGNPSTAGFWADASVVERMIRDGGDTWAFSSVKGFPARDSDWFVRLAPVRLERIACLTSKERLLPCVLLPCSP